MYNRVMIYKDYEILCQTNKQNYYVGNLRISNKDEVQITNNIPFFYSKPVYCFEFNNIGLIFICYFELINGQITLQKIKQNESHNYFFSFELINMLSQSDKEKLQLPKLIDKMVYRWLITTINNDYTEIFTTNNGIVKVFQKSFITNMVLSEEKNIYEIKLKYNRLRSNKDVVSFQIIFPKNQEPHIECNDEEWYIKCGNNLYHICYKNKSFAYFYINKDNVLEFIEDSLFYTGIYWIQIKDKDYFQDRDTFDSQNDDTFICPFQLDGFYLKLKDNSNFELSNISSMKENLQDFEYGKNPIILKNTEKMVHEYNIYYGKQDKVDDASNNFLKEWATIFTKGEEIRFSNKENYLLYNNVSYMLDFSINGKKYIKEIISNENNMENVNLQCKFISLAGRLILLNECFYSKIIAMGKGPLEEFNQLSPARNVLTNWNLMVSNTNNYYEISFEDDGKIFDVGILLLTKNHKVKIKKGIPFFYAEQTYCFEFTVICKSRSIYKSTYKCYFELVNGEIIIKTIPQNDNNFFKLKNVFEIDSKEEFVCPKVIDKMVYPWITNGSICTCLLTDSNGMVKIHQKNFVTRLSFNNDIGVYEVKNRYKNKFVTCQIIYKKNKFYLAKNYGQTYENFTVDKHPDFSSSSEVYELCYKGYRIMEFGLDDDNMIEIRNDILGYAGEGIYWIQFDGRDNTFSYPFKMNKFKIEPEDDNDDVYSYDQYSLEAILEDFDNSPYPIIINNSYKISKEYLLYNNTEIGIASLFTHNQEVRLDANDWNKKENWLFYKDGIYTLNFEKRNVIEEDIEEDSRIQYNQFIIVNKDPEKNLLQCKFTMKNEKLVVLTKGFSVINETIGLEPLEKFNKLKPAINEV